MNLARSLGSVGGLTLVSRILALVRDMLQAQLRRRKLRVRRFLRRIPPSQHVSARCLPKAPSRPLSSRCSTARSAETDDVSTGLRLRRADAGGSSAVLLLFTILMIAAAWPITWGLSGGFKNPTHEQFAFAVMLSRITIPYLMLISLASLLGGILNSLHKFWVNAAAPILLNIAMIVGACGSSTGTDRRRLRNGAARRRFRSRWRRIAARAG